MELPPLVELRHVTQLYAEALSALAVSPGEQPLVLPNADWFPDRFNADQDSLAGLVARMQGYAGLEAVEIDAFLTGDVPGAGCDTGGCGSGACGTPKVGLEAPRLSALGKGRYGLEMPAKALGHSIALTASIARMLGQVRLLEAGRENPAPAQGELSAVGLGFGVLLLEASHLYAKGCGGPSVGKATALGCAQLALPFALFVATEGHKLRPALAELAVTQRALVDEAWALTQSNRALVERLRAHPERVARGDFKLGEARSWLSRLFGGGSAKGAGRDQAALEALERGESLDEIASMLDPKPKRAAQESARKPSPEDAELEGLVDEALSELRGEPVANQRNAAGPPR